MKKNVLSYNDITLRICEMSDMINEESRWIKIANNYCDMEDDETSLCISMLLGILTKNNEKILNEIDKLLFDISNFL